MSETWQPGAEAIYGELTAHLHDAGYTFERAMQRLESLLEGERWKEFGYEKVNDFIGSLDLKQFSAVAEQRKRIARLIKDQQPKVSNVAIGKALDVAEGTIRKDYEPRKKKDSENKDATRNNRESANERLSGAKVAQMVAKREAQGEVKQAALDRTQAVEFAAESIGKFAVIYADPPWRYEHAPAGGPNRAIENHYPTMSLEEICALPVGNISNDDAVLFMWATSPKLAECLNVLEAWGFEYRTNMVWVKDRIGTGYHARGQHELLLIAKKGALPPPPPERRPSSVVESPRLEHSAKPQCFYELIDGMYPDLRKVELFARGLDRVGWSAWGNQANAA